MIDGREMVWGNTDEENLNIFLMQMHLFATSKDVQQ